MKSRLQVPNLLAKNTTKNGLADLRNLYI